MHPTPLRVDKIVGILEAGSTPAISRSIEATRVMGKPLGRFMSAPLRHLADG
jgi:hypothetical protein